MLYMPWQVLSQKHKDSVKHNSVIIPFSDKSNVQPLNHSVTLLYTFSANRVKYNLWGTEDSSLTFAYSLVRIK